MNCNACPPLRQLVEAYCQHGGEVEWREVVWHLGGQCPDCLKAVLQMCERVLPGRSRAAARAGGQARTPQPRDLCQELVVRLAELRPESRWQAPSGSLKAWLSVVVRNLAWRLLSAASARRELPVGDFPQDDAGDVLDRAPDAEIWAAPVDLLTSREERMLVYEALHSLEYPYRQIIALSYLHGETLKNIADAFGISVSSAYRRVLQGARAAGGAGG